MLKTTDISNDPTNEDSLHDTEDDNERLKKWFSGLTHVYHPVKIGKTKYKKTAVAIKKDKEIKHLPKWVKK